MSGEFDFRYPNVDTFTADQNADKVRSNAAFSEEAAMFAGAHPDYESFYTYTGSRLNQVEFREITAAATARGRASGTRIFGRIIYTYTGSSLTKAQTRISYDAGSTFSDWQGFAAFDFANYNYTGSQLTSITRSAT